MRVSFFTENAGQMEIQETTGVLVDTQNYDFNAEKGNVDVTIILHDQSKVVLRAEDDKALNFIKSANELVKEGVVQFGRDDAKVQERFDKEGNRTYSKDWSKEMEDKLPDDAIR